MSKDYPYLHIPDTDFSADLAGIIAKMNSLCEELSRDATQRKNVDELNSLFWQFITAYIPTLITDETKETLSIPPGFEDCINYGFISESVCPDAESQLEAINQKIKNEKTVYEIITFGAWIKKVYDQLLRLDTKRRIEKELRSVEEEFAAFSALIATCHERRQEFKNKYPPALKVLQISEEIDERLPVYFDIKKKIERSLRLSASERIEYVRLTEEISKLREYRAKEQQAISTHVPQYELMRLDRDIEQIMASKREVEERLEAARSAQREDQEFRRGVSARVCREKMREELRRLRSITEMIGRRSRVKASSILIDAERIPTPQAIAAALEEILEVDQTIFLRDSYHKRRFPLVVLIPAFGDGAYDVEKNVFFVPLRSPKGLLQSLANAFIEYHLDSQSGTSFRNSYLALKKNQNINSSIQLRDAIVRDYIGWVTLEAKGYQALDQEARAWFIEHVAPPMFALKHPRSLSMETIPIREVHAFIDEYEARDDPDQSSSDDLLKIGIAYWRTRQYIKANHAFLQAFKHNPRSKDACYNAALGCFKTGQKAKARDYWKHYLSLDKVSFWTVRVQKFLSTVK
jgi:tetratricopeptide (TPR) repeat protein